MAELTPLMRQYNQIKKQHQDKILFFRMGDFFEMFNEDAEIAAPILNIALTYRNKRAGLKTKVYMSLSVIKLNPLKTLWVWLKGR